MGSASLLLRFQVYSVGDTHIRLLRHKQGLHDCVCHHNYVHAYAHTHTQGSTAVGHAMLRPQLQ